VKVTRGRRKKGTTALIFDHSNENSSDSSEEDEEFDI